VGGCTVPTVEQPFTIRKDKSIINIGIFKEPPEAVVNYSKNRLPPKMQKKKRDGIHPSLSLAECSLESKRIPACV
jgi:hypothetical protein